MFIVRRFLFAISLSLSLSLFASSVQASPENPKNGVEYMTLDTPQAVEAGKKIEVTEFFLYGCPHCHAFDPALTEWVKKQGEKIAFKRIHVAFSESAIPQQRLHFALEAMALPKPGAEELHKKIFNAIHVERLPLSKEDAIAEFIAKQGVDKAKFLELYRSFSVQTKANRATQMQASYKIEGVPTVAIDGRFLTSPAMASVGLPAKASETMRQAAALQVMDSLLAKAMQEREAHAKSAASSEAGTAKAKAKTKNKAKTKTPAKESHSH